MTRDEAAAAMERQGVAPDLIVKALDLNYGPLPRVSGVTTRGDLPQPTATISYVGPVLLPFRLVVPWSKLCSDNEKEQPALTRGKDGTIHPRRKTSLRYKASKDAIRELARAVVGKQQPTPAPLAITVEVWLPPSRRNDSINFAKVVGDALEGVVYVNDNQLHASHWYRRGTDIDAPRAEITITPL
jgi:Holliday junction resolvase RusA-like endonuclease